MIHGEASFISRWVHEMHNQRAGARQLHYMPKDTMYTHCKWSYNTYRSVWLHSKCPLATVTNIAWFVVKQWPNNVLTSNTSLFSARSSSAPLRSIHARPLRESGIPLRHLSFTWARQGFNPKQLSQFCTHKEGDEECVFGRDRESERGRKWRKL